MIKLITFIKKLLRKEKGRAPQILDGSRGPVEIQPWGTSIETLYEGYNKVANGSFLSRCTIGYMSYVSEGTKLVDCIVGRYCSIAQEVKIISYTHPSKNFVSTHPAFFSTLKQSGKTYVDKQKFLEQVAPKYDGYRTKIGNDVWIGAYAHIIEGVKIGDGAIIAADAMVVKDVPDYAIVGGVPAKIIGYRFSDEQIGFLQKLKWWDKNEAWVEQNADYFSSIEDFKRRTSDEFNEKEVNLNNEI